MEILSKFPHQVIILKNNRNICGLRGRQAGLQRRMIDNERTKQFPGFCKLLEGPNAGHPKLIQHLKAQGDEANRHMNKILDDAKRFPDFVRNVKAVYGKEDIKKINKKELTPEILRKLFAITCHDARELFDRNPKEPKIQEVTNLYTFRYALMVHALVLKWLFEKGIESRREEDIRNDLVDMNHVAYATYFDGVLSEDKLVNEIYSHGTALLGLIKHGFSTLRPD